MAPLGRHSMLGWSALVLLALAPASRATTAVSFGGTSVETMMYNSLTVVNGDRYVCGTFYRFVCLVFLVERDASKNRRELAAGSSPASCEHHKSVRCDAVGHPSTDDVKRLIPPPRGNRAGAVYPSQRVGATSPSRRGDRRSKQLKTVSLFVLQRQHHRRHHHADQLRRGVRRCLHRQARLDQHRPVGQVLWCRVLQ
jgi:hypothetical protein